MPVIYNQIIKSKKKSRGKNRRFILLCYSLMLLPAIALIAVYFLFRGDVKFASSVVSNFSFPFRRFVGKVTSFVPFSVTELLYLAIAVFAIVFILLSIRAIIKSKHKSATVFRRIYVVVLIFVYYYGTFYFLWGFDYYTPTFAEKAGLSTSAFTTDELIAVTKYFVNNASLYAQIVSRDNHGDFSENIPLMFDACSGVYSGVQATFPILQNTIYTPKPMYLFSEIMSLTGFTGIYVEYTGESSINIKAPAYTIPCTISHEISHQLGVYAEDEANFLGILACVSSDNNVYKYSGFFGGSIHLMNALYQVDKDAWQEIYNTFEDDFKHDWNYNNKYWEDKNTVISKTFSNWYDKYLKSNGQTSGIASYSQCIKLLVNYFATQEK